MSQISGTKDPDSDSEGEPVAQSVSQPQSQPQDLPNPSDNNTDSVTASVEEQEIAVAVAVEEKPPLDHPMEEDSVNTATVFTISLKQSKSNLRHKMSVPELCRNFRSVSLFSFFICSEIYTSSYLSVLQYVFFNSWFYIFCHRKKKQKKLD